MSNDSAPCEGYGLDCDAMEQAKDLLIETLYDAIHEMLPHYTRLYAAHAPDEKLPHYDAIKEQATNAMNAKSEYEEKREELENEN